MTRGVCGGVAIVALLCAGGAGAQGFGVTAVPQGTNVTIEYEARTDAYYRVLSRTSLTAGTWAVREMQAGEWSTQEWTDVGVLTASTLGTTTQRQYYRVSRIWVTNSLDYDADGLWDSYELTNSGLSVFDPDSDSDGSTDGDEVLIFGSRPSSPYSGPDLVYTFDTNTQGWSGEDWGYGAPVLAWTNTGYPLGGALCVTPSAGTASNAKYYVKDGSVIDNRDARLKPIGQFYVYVPAGAPLPPEQAVRAQIFVRSSSDGWSYDNKSGYFLPQPGQWTLLGLSNISDTVLADADEWGLELIWGDRAAWNGPVLIDTVHQATDLPPTAAPAVTSVSAAAGIVARYEKFELTVGLTNTAGLNPYDPADIDLGATFVSPSGRTWRINGFYMEEGSAAGDGAWRVRFAPDETGTWSYALSAGNYLGTNNSSTSTFSCVTGGRHGWVRVSDDDPHYLEHHDDTPFFGVGYCRCWDADDEGVFQEAEEHGINMIHWWMAPWDTMLTVERADATETWRERSTFYSFEQGRAAELDRVVGHAEAHGVKFVFTIWPHDAIRDFNYHKWRINGSWQKAFDTKFSEPEWYINAFSTLESPARNQKFFHDAEYRRYQENLYRYIIARWGYSEAIGCWALASEMFGTFANSLNCIEYQAEAWVTNKNALFGENPFLHMDLDQCDGKDYTISWLSAVHDYFRTHDPFGHPTTASYATDEYWEHGFPVVDLPQIHTYADLYSWITPPVTLAKYHHYLRERYDKPAFMGEIGTVDWKHYEPDYVRVTTWPAVCSGAAITPMMWTTPPFSWFGDAKMGPWLGEMSDAAKVLAAFVAGMDFPREGFVPADIHTAAAGEPPVTAIESFEGGVNGWSKHGAGATSIEIDTNHATDGGQCLRVNIDIPTWAEMPSPEPGIEKYGMSYNWTSYWPNGTLKMDVALPEFYHPEDNPDGFLLGINKDPRSIIEVHCATDAYGNGWTWYSTTNEYASEGGWKKLTVGMLYNLELKLSTLPSAAQAANIKGIKFKFGNAGILRGPIFIDRIEAGLYAFNTVGLVNSNRDFAFAWIQDRRWTNVTAAGATLQVNGLQTGVYHLEWWNTLTGPFASYNASAATGTLSVTAPDFVKDVAVKIRRVGAAGETRRDIGVAAVSSYDWVLRSPTQAVAVLVVNQGSTSETVSVTLTNTTDGQAIGTNLVALAAGACTNTLFSWNTTNLLGLRTVTAMAGPVAGEADTADNRLAGTMTIRSNAPPWDSCDRLRRWKEDATDSDARTLAVSTNRATEETHSLRMTYRAPDKGQAYFGYDQVYENWSNRSVLVYDLYNDGSATNAQVLMRTGEGWVWHYSPGIGIGPGWTTNITVGFHSNLWTRAVWSDAITNYVYSYNVPVGGLEQIQQIFLKVSGYAIEGSAYVDNIRLQP